MHIVFDKEDAGRLRESFELDPSLKSEVVVLDDDYSIGPLKDEDLENGSNFRDAWLAGVFSKPIDAVKPNVLENISSALETNPEENVLLWISPNNRDVSGYYFLISNLKNFGQRISVIWLNNLPFINEKGQVFYPRYLKEIPAKEFLKARKLAVEVSPAIYETDPDEWQKQVDENKLLRVLEGAKKLSGKEVTFFDNELKGQMNFGWQKSVKAINQVLSKSKYTVPESFLLWRLREMVRENILEVRGEWVNSANFELKKPGGEIESTIDG